MDSNSRSNKVTDSNRSKPTGVRLHSRRDTQLSNRVDTVRLLRRCLVIEAKSFEICEVMCRMKSGNADER